MKLLVTTDFSVNSKGAIRFAQNLAKQTKDLEVTFFHSIHVYKPAMWSNSGFEQYKKEELERLSILLKKFIYSVIGQNNSDFKSITLVVEEGVSIEDSILTFSEINKIDLICIATRGAGLLRKIMGTHTSYLISHSKIPVLVIPSRYRAKPIKRITYLSDLENIKKELDHVINFSKEIQPQIEVLHYSSIIFDKEKFDKDVELFNSKEYKDIKLNIRKNNLELSLLERAGKYLEKSKPELLIMFTKRDKSIFEKLFLPSTSVELTFTTKIPILIFSK
jgi:nucleotide-binding universal stress UspA family protein